MPCLVSAGSRFGICKLPFPIGLNSRYWAARAQPEQWESCVGSAHLLLVTYAHSLAGKFVVGGVGTGNDAPAVLLFSKPANEDSLGQLMSQRCTLDQIACYP